MEAGKKLPRVEIFMACDANYAPHLCAAMASAMDNTRRSLRFNILSNALPEGIRAKIAECAGTRAEVEFLEVDKSLFAGFDVKLKHLSIEACYRYCAAKIRPELGKAVYLDCDTIVLGDIGELFDSDISGVCAGGVDDVIKESYVKSLGLGRYFNSGVMLLNLAKMRETRADERLFKTTAELSGKSKYLDQDALNIVFAGDEIFLPQKWNAVAPLFRRSPKSKFAPPCELAEAAENPAIAHFTGPDKPWKIPRSMLAHPFAPAYFYYLSKTPFAAEARKFRASFRPLPSLANYFKRHLFFFLRPQFWKMRRLYARNLGRFRG